jgi:uncharacterized protein (DUF2345 family)
VMMGSAGSSALFAREEALVYGDRVASVSSADTARVVGERQVDIHSPNSVELAGRRAVTVSSAHVVDVRTGQFHLRAGPEGAPLVEPLPESISVALLGEKTLRMKSVHGKIVACAEDAMILHSHTNNVEVSAKGTVSLHGSAITGAAGMVSLHAEEDLELQAKGDLSILAEGDIGVGADGDLAMDGTEVRINADGSVTIKAASIRLDGPTTIDGPLTVSGTIKSG